MKHYILYTLLCMTWITFPTMSYAANAEPSDENAVSVSVNDDAANFSVAIGRNSVQLHALNCQGQVLKVYDMVGKLKYEVTIDSNDKTIRLIFSKGIYLINLNQVTRRVSIVG